MTLEQQVCSLELAQKLKELGVKQESLFWHAEYKTGGWNVQNWHWVITESLFEGDYEQYRNQCSAFTVAELGEVIGKAKNVEIIKAYGHVMNVPDTRFITEIGLLYCMTQPDIGAKMLIYLLENKLITLES